jgi:hypothetical protein
MFDLERHKQINRRMLEPFPPELVGEYPAVDVLRQVHRMAKITANLLDDARIYGDMPDEQEYSQLPAIRRIRCGKSDALGCGRSAAGDD